MSVKLYTVDNCGYCKVAKELLAFKQVPYTEVKVPRELSTQEFAEKYPDVRQFPLIIDESTSNRIGGFRDLQEWLLSRENQQLLNENIKDLTL